MATVDLVDINTLKTDETLVQATMGSKKEVSDGPKQPVDIGVIIRKHRDSKEPLEATDRVLDALIPSKAEMKARATGIIGRELVDKKGGKLDVITNEMEKVWDYKDGSLKQGLHKDAEEAIDLSHALLKRGYDSMSQPKKDAAVDSVKKALAIHWPATKEIFARLDATEVRSMMETFLRDPKFMEKMTKRFNKLKETQVPPVNPETKKKYDEAKAKFDDIKAAFTAMETKVKIVERTFEEFRNDGTDKGALTLALEKEGLLSDAKEDYDKQDNKLSALHEEVVKYDIQLRRFDILASKKKDKYTEEDTKFMNEHSDRKTIEDDKKEWKKQFDDQQVIVRNARDKVDRIEKLLNLKKEASEQYEQTTKEREQLRVKYSRAQTDMLDAQADLNLAEEENDALKKKFVSDLKNMFAHSTIDILKERLESADEVRQQLAKDAFGDNFKAVMINRWNILGEKKPRLDTARIQADFDLLLDPKEGPRAIIRDMLTDPKHVGEKGFMSEEQVDEYMAQNPEAMAKAEQAVALEVMSKVFNEGSKVTFTPEHLRIIQSSEWGPRVIVNALQKSKEIDADFKMLEADGKFTVPPDWKERIMEKLKKFPASGVFKLLLLALGLYFGPIVAPGIAHGVGRVIGNDFIGDRLNALKDLIGDAGGSVANGVGNAKDAVLDAGGDVARGVGNAKDAILNNDDVTDTLKDVKSSTNPFN